MGYPTGEAAILTLIRGLAAYDTNNSDRQDWKMLNQGKAAVYAVLRPGAWVNAQEASVTYHRAWTTVIEVWRRYIDDTRPVTLQTDVQTVIEHLEKYPTLNGASGVISAMISGGGDMQERELNNGSLWAVWDIYCEWTEEKQVTYAE